MSPAVFIDANVPIYAAGRDHSLRGPCAEVLFLAAQYSPNFVTDAEVLQELLHRYVALRTWAGGQAAFYRFSEVMRGRVEAVHFADVERAAVLANAQMRVSARDLVHLAVMQRLCVRHIASADKGFDLFPEVERLDPAHWESWRHLVMA